MLAVLCLAALLLAYANGANDNFKGFATIWGSGEASYKSALCLASLTTAAGAIASLYIADGLAANFSGRGLVPNELAGTAPFLFAVALGAGLTVLLATRLGLPISTTHAIIGALLGAGIAARGLDMNFGWLGGTFLLPLLVSPVLSAVLAMALYWIVVRIVPEQTLSSTGVCICEAPSQLAHTAGAAAVVALPSDRALYIGTSLDCRNAGATPLASASALSGIRGLHFLSAGTICFARAVNDTPKLTALLLASRVAGLEASFWVLGAAMVAGGWLNGRRVAETMSRKIAPLAHEQGLVANLVTSGLVLSASAFALPVSTTHVSVGSISGTGIVTGKINRAEIGKIVLSWVVTLPIAALLAAAALHLIWQGA